MQIQTDPLHQACQQLKTVADDLALTPPQNIGYRERVRIERPIFLVMKEICQRNLGYELHGLSVVHHNELKVQMKIQNCSKSLRDLIRKAFELKIFLLDLSSADPYVRDDALSRASLTKQNAMRNIRLALYAIAQKAMEQKGGRVIHVERSLGN